MRTNAVLVAKNKSGLSPEYTHENGADDTDGQQRPDDRRLLQELPARVQRHVQKWVDVGRLQRKDLVYSIHMSLVL